MDFMFTVLQSVNSKVQADRDKFPERYIQGLHFGHTKLIKYYNLTDETPIYRAAVVLHPAYKFDYFEHTWGPHLQWIRRCKKDVTALYNEYEERYSHPEEEEGAEQVNPLRLMYNTRRGSEGSSGDEGFHSFGRLPESYRARKRQRLRNELDRYTEFVPTVREANIVDPLAYWQGLQSTYPVLYRMAMDIFSIPAMSSECERKFSSADDTITDERNRLGDDVIEALEVQKDWLQKDLIKRGQ